MIKKVLLTALVIMLALSLLTACSPKEYLTGAGFADIVERAGYTVDDFTDDFDGPDYAYIQAVAPDGSFIIDFFVAASVEETRDMYKEIKKELDSLGGVWRSRIQNNAANYNLYRGTNDGVYYVASRIENTLLYIETDAEYRKEVDEILEKLGYK